MKYINTNENLYPPLAYVCCGGSSKVAIIDLATHSQVGDIYCGEDSDPYYIAINPNKKFAYVGDYIRKMILLLDLKENRLIGQTAVIGRPRSIDVSPCGDKIYVVFDDEPFIQVFGESLQNIGQIPIPSSSGGISITNAGLLAYVTQPALNITIVVDLCRGCIIKNLATGLNPGRTAYSLERNMVLVSGRGSNTLTHVNTAGICTGSDILLNGMPSGLAFTRGNKNCIVALPREDKADIVDICSNEVIAEISVGELPGGTAASKIYPVAVVCNQISSTVSIINTETFTVNATLNVGNDPAGVAIIN